MTPSSLRVPSDIGNDEFTAAIEQFARRFSEYRARLPHIPYAYTRTRLHATPHYEIIAMQWAPGSVSPIHDHGRSHCWVLMLEGTLHVENFQRDDPAASPVVLRPTGENVLRAGELDYRNGPLELHRVRNPAESTAFSLQLYAEPIGTYTIVDPHSRTSRLVTATCDLDLCPP